MIDIESMIFTAISDAVTTAYPTAFVCGDYVEAPAEFPCVTVVEADNSVLARTRDLDAVEHHAVLMYEINIYTNDGDTAKSKAKAIAQIIDGVMSANLFTRTFKYPVPNIDRTIYRITLRYKGVAGEAINTGQKIIYPMYTTD